MFFLEADIQKLGFYKYITHNPENQGKFNFISAVTIRKTATYLQRSSLRNMTGYVERQVRTGRRSKGEGLRAESRESCMGVTDYSLISRLPENKVYILAKGWYGGTELCFISFCPSVSRCACPVSHLLSLSIQHAKFQHTHAHTHVCFTWGHCIDLHWFYVRLKTFSIT